MFQKKNWFSPIINPLVRYRFFLLSSSRFFFTMILLSVCCYYPIFKYDFFFIAISFIEKHMENKTKQNKKPSRPDWIESTGKKGPPCLCWSWPMSNHSFSMLILIRQQRQQQLGFFLVCDLVWKIKLFHVFFSFSLSLCFCCYL